MKNKSAETTQNVLQKHSQATEEQLRVAKLSQMTKDSHEEEIKMVADITRKPLDIVSLALHDSNYDTSVAIQNIFEGKYEAEDEWQTKSTKRNKKSGPVLNNTTDFGNDKLDVIDIKDNDQKPNDIKNISRGGGTSGTKGRPSSHNRKDDRFSDDRRDGSEERSTDFSRDRMRGSDRGGRMRGRGRGGGRGASRGGRGGFGRGGAARGSGRPVRGAGRGGRGGRRGDGRREENGFGEPLGGGFGAPSSGFGEPSSGGFGDPAGRFGQPVKEETWDVDEKTEDWGLEDTTTSTTTANTETKLETDWSKDWGDEEMEELETTNEKVDSLFSHKLDWGHVNGKTEENSWADKEQPSNTLPAMDSGKYVPEQIDPAVISSIPTPASSAEATSYQPTNDISRYITNSAASNQFPSSQQEGGLTSSLNERDFTTLTESLQTSLSSLPIVSGITESHKLEQEQRDIAKSMTKIQQHQPIQKLLPGPSRKPLPKNSSQPVVMPRSAKMVHDVEEQFAGLEFGSGPVSPRLLKVANSSPAPYSSDLNNTESLEISATRQPIAILQEPTPMITPSTPPKSTITQPDLVSHPTILPNDTPPTPTIPTEPANPSQLPPSDPIDVTNSITSSLNAFQSLESSQNESKSHYLGSPGRGITHSMASDANQYSSASKLPASPTSTSSLDVFARHSGLGTSVTMAMDPKQKLSSYHDSPKAYSSVEKNSDKLLSENKQFLAEQQRALAALAEQQREHDVITEQRAAFAEQKALAQQKLLASQRSKDDTRPATDSLNNSLKETRPTDNRLGITESSPLQVKDSPSKNSTTSDASSYTSKGHPHRSNNTRSISSPPGLSSSVYTSNTSKNSELLSQAASSATNSTTKSQSKTSSAPPGMIHPNLMQYPGVQPGMLPYQQLHGYNNYEELLQLQQRAVHMPQSPYHYDVSTMYPTPTATATREGIAGYQGAETKFARASGDETTGLHQANAHVAAGNINAQHAQAYMNAAGQLPYGFTYAYQPGVMPGQAPGLYPAFTTPNVYLNQAGGGSKGVVGTQYQSQYTPQTFNSAKYSGSGNHDFKGNYHNSSSQTTLTKSGNPSVNSGNDSGQNNASFKGQGYNDGKAFLGTSPSSQPGMTLHGQNTHLNPYLLAQQQQQNSLLASQVSANQIGHQGSHDNRSGFSGSQQKREGKGSYQSYWSGSR
ncbi:ubiquitin-associated protein 2-like isoform X1 [Clytia hemisphaerica]|uniref:Uncharacterized protein n=1 Tax=Clytia hemisphaerica TaxID=252671 RepID=A0A7M5TWL9_9CNID